MVTISASILISQPADAVFHYVSNYENDPQWRAAVTEMQHIPPGDVHEGMQTREVLRLMGQETVNIAEIVEVVPGRRTAFRTIESPFSASGYRLVEEVGGRTRFTYHADAELRGAYRLATPLIVPLFRRQVRGDLARLKEILESGESIESD